MDEKELIKNLTLALMYLTSWDEKIFDSSVKQTWKGYDFDVLDELEDEELIYRTKGKQPFIILDKGVEKAKYILENLEYKQI